MSPRRPICPCAVLSSYWRSRWRTDAGPIFSARSPVPCRWHAVWQRHCSPVIIPASLGLPQLFCHLTCLQNMSTDILGRLCGRKSAVFFSLQYLGTLSHFVLFCWKIAKIACCVDSVIFPACAQYIGLSAAVHLKRFQFSHIAIFKSPRLTTMQCYWPCYCLQQPLLDRLVVSTISPQRRTRTQHSFRCS